MKLCFLIYKIFYRCKRFMTKCITSCYIIRVRTCKCEVVAEWVTFRIKYSNYLYQLNTRSKFYS